MNSISAKPARNHAAVLLEVKAGTLVFSICGKACFAHERGQHPSQGNELPLSTFRQLHKAGLLRQQADGSFSYEANANSRQPQVNDKESPLYRLFHRSEPDSKRYISQQQYQAGERLRADFERSHMAQRITSSWSGERVDQSNHAALSDNKLAYLTDSALDARKRLHQAFDAVGPELAAVLYYVCCLASGLEQAERFMQLPPRSGKAVLALALTRLARHYRLIHSPSPSATSKDLAHWALADYRPAIMPQGQPGPQP